MLRLKLVVTHKAVREQVGLGEVGVGGDEGEGVLTGIDDDVLVVQDVQELQLRAPPVLRRAEDVPLAPL